MSLDQVADIIRGRHPVNSDRHGREVSNLADAYSSLGRINLFDISEVLRMHSIVANGLVPDAGRFRSCGEGVFSGNECIFMAPPPDMVPVDMNGLFDWLNSEKDVLHHLILSSILHYEIVFIYPFSDCNGRIARLWQNALLRRWSPVFRSVSFEDGIMESRGDYYAAIDRSNAEGSSETFVEYVLQAILRVLTGIGDP